MENEKSYGRAFVPLLQLDAPLYFKSETWLVNFVEEPAISRQKSFVIAETKILSCILHFPVTITL